MVSPSWPQSPEPWNLHHHHQDILPTLRSVIWLVAAEVTDRPKTLISRPRSSIIIVPVVVVVVIVVIVIMMIIVIAALWPSKGSSVQRLPGLSLIPPHTGVNIWCFIIIIIIVIIIVVIVIMIIIITRRVPWHKERPCSLCNFILTLAPASP